jgi:hypothetical protein
MTLQELEDGLKEIKFKAFKKYRESDLWPRYQRDFGWQGIVYMNDAGLTEDCLPSGALMWRQDGDDDDHPDLIYILATSDPLHMLTACQGLVIFLEFMEKLTASEHVRERQALEVLKK